MLSRQHLEVASYNKSSACAPYVESSVDYPIDPMKWEDLQSVEAVMKNRLFRNEFSTLLIASTFQ